MIVNALCLLTILADWPREAFGAVTCESGPIICAHSTIQTRLRSAVVLSYTETSVTYIQLHYAWQFPWKRTSEVYSLKQHIKRLLALSSLISETKLIICYVAALRSFSHILVLIISMLTWSSASSLLSSGSSVMSSSWPLSASRPEAYSRAEAGN